MRLKLCQLAMAVFFAALCVVLFGLSFLSAISYVEPWEFANYWRGWFAAISFIAGAAAAIGAGIGFTAFFMNLCDAAQAMDRRATQAVRVP